jgi:hypothetical protein
MTYRASYLAAFLMLCAAHQSAWAQTVTLEQLCGKFPDFSFTEREREVSETEADGRVDVLKRFFGSGELAGRLRTERERYYQRDPQGRAPQIDAILLYKICTFLERDSKMTTLEKIRIFLEVRAGLSAPIAVPQAPAVTTPTAIRPAPANVPPAAVPQIPSPPNTERLNLDGQWIVATRWRDCRNPGRSFPISVSNGIVSSQVARQMQGSLSTNGAIQFNYVVRDTRGFVWTNFMEGKISGEKGAGSARSLGRRTNCSGEFQIARSH